MLLVISMIGILIIICGIYADLEGAIGVGGFITAISLVISAIMLAEFPYNVDKKLAMYQEENTNIETKVKATVQAYMNYEQSTYKNLVENADLTTLIIKYPELNANELVKVEINTYKENNKKIKQLKEKQIDKGIMAWWLYFGN